MTETAVVVVDDGKKAYGCDLNEWELKHPGEVHYRPEGEAACVHATPTCGGMVDPPSIPGATVEAMWGDGQDMGLTPRRVQWCETCACRPVA